MKRKYFSNRLLTHSTIWFGCAAACCSLSLQMFATAGTPTTPTPAAPAPAAAGTNVIGFAVGDTASYGDKAAYQSRFAQTADFYGGISNLNWQGDVADGVSLALEGHALFGMEDYGFLGTLNKNGLGYVQLGYKQFRTWYDASGGFVPGAVNSWIPLYDDDVSVDRGQVWFEAGLRMENMPEFTFRYTHDWRDGTKDSTSWGTSTAVAPAPGYKNVPSLNLIDETTDTFRLDFTHTLGTTDFGGGVSFQTIKNDDTRVMRNGVSAANYSLGTRVQDNATYDSDIFGANLFSQTRLCDRVMFGFSYNFSNLDTDVGGNRPSNNAAAPYALRTSQDHALFGILGGTQGTINVVDANLRWNPIDDLVIIPSIRGEFENTAGWASHIAGVRGNPDATEADLATALAGGPLAYAIAPSGTNRGKYVPTLASEIVSTNNEVNQFAETIEARYSGIENILLYGKAEFSQLEGAMRRADSATQANVTTPPAIPGYSSTADDRATDSEIDKQKYTIGANWYPCSGVSLSAQAYYKNSDAYYDNSGSEAAMLRQSNYDTTDVNFRVTWRALPTLTLVSRYDYQHTNMDTQAEPYGAGTSLFVPGVIESADITSNIFTQSVTWMPIERAYLAGSFSYVDSTTATGAFGNPAYVNSDSDNDYLTLSVTAGYAIDDKTDVTATYSYYYADNYALPRNVTTGVPAMGYGTSIEENVFSVSLNRQITPAMLWSLGYGYYTGTDSTSGGNNDFSAHMFSTGLQIRF